ncbi:MAG: hypothetical protein IPK59_13280 [Rhodospirillaceae bacterium]|nr:hypothetical protein [Rhodospirillaceae bacterium]
MPTLLSLESLEADRRFVEEQLARDKADRWGTTRLMWENRLADINEQIDSIKRSTSSHASVALVFDGLPVIGSHDIRLDFAADILDSYQKIISTMLASNNALPILKSGPVRGAQASQLFIRDIVRGSFGFVLEELVPNQSSFVSSNLKNAVESATRLIEELSGTAEDEFESALNAAPPRLISAIQKFAKVLATANASTKIIGDENQIGLSGEVVDRLNSRLNDIKVTDNTDWIDGILLGILPESHEFELKLGELGEILKGSVSDELVLKYTTDAIFKDQLLLKPVRAKVQKITTSRKGKPIKELNTLESVEPTLVDE